MSNKTELKFIECVKKGEYEVDEKMMGFFIECIKKAGYVEEQALEAKTHISLKQEVSKTGKVLSGYQKFVKAKSGKGVTMTEIAKEWKALSEADKVHWKGEEVIGSGISGSPVKAKRGQSTWNVYVKDQIHELKKLCKEGEKFNLTGAMKGIGQSWKALPLEDRKNYKSKLAVTAE